MTYSFLQSEIDQRTIQFKIERDGAELSFEDTIDLLISSNDFKDELTSVLCSVKFEGFFWEVKPIIQDLLSQPFEFVVVEGSQFTHIVADKSNFQEYFDAENSVVTFFNLGRDAKLIVPSEKDPETNYAHLAGFLRSAQQDQIREFWRQVGLNYKELINDNKLSLSTAGLGVSWLHVRFDKRPKYYRYQPYK